MDAFNRRSQQSGMFSPAIFNFDHLEPRVQSHLKNVYGTLSIGMLSAALGAYAHFATGIGQWYFLTTIASFALIFWLASTRHVKEDIGKRVAIFGAFTGLSGISLGPLLELVMYIEPSIISTALAGTALIFISFTMASLLSSDRKFLYMGGFLMTGLTSLVFLGFINVFFRSQMIFDLHIWGSLFLFSAFVLYDTQLIIEKKRRGDDDFIWHSLELFLDAIQIFRALLVILAKKEDNKKKRRDN